MKNHNTPDDKLKFPELATPKSRLIPFCFDNIGSFTIQNRKNKDTDNQKIPFPLIKTKLKPVALENMSANNRRKNSFIIESMEDLDFSIAESLSQELSREENSNCFKKKSENEIEKCFIK